MLERRSQSCAKRRLLTLRNTHHLWRMLSTVMFRTYSMRADPPMLSCSSKKGSLLLQLAGPDPGHYSEPLYYSLSQHANLLHSLKKYSDAALKYEEGNERCRQGMADDRVLYNHGIGLHNLRMYEDTALAEREAIDIRR